MKFTKIINSRYILALGFLIALYILWWGISNAGGYSSVPEPLVSHHIVGRDKYLQEEWSRSGAFLGTNHMSFDAAAGRLLALGTFEPNRSITINAINGTDGELIWHTKYDSRLVTLSVTRTRVYVGTRGGAQVRAYDMETGDKIWTKRFFAASVIEYLDNYDGKLYVSTSDDKYYVLQADTGEPTQDLGDGWQINEKYLAIGDKITKDVIFERRGDGLGYIAAIDKKTEELLWESEKDVISNIAATESTAYFLTLDGRLVGLDALSGDIVATVKFEPAPFILNGPDAIAGGYFVAVDEDEKMLYAQLGDSFQLFAFKLVE